jgi:hypothetical protein
MSCLLILLLALYLCTEWVPSSLPCHFYIYIYRDFLPLYVFFIQSLQLHYLVGFFFKNIVVDYFWHVMFRIYCYFLGLSGHGFSFSYLKFFFFGGEEIGRATQMLTPVTTKGILASLGK